MISRIRKGNGEDWENLVVPSCDGGGGSRNKRKRIGSPDREQEQIGYLDPPRKLFQQPHSAHLILVLAAACSARLSCIY